MFFFNFNFLEKTESYLNLISQMQAVEILSFHEKKVDEVVRSYE